MSVPSQHRDSRTNILVGKGLLIISAAIESEAKRATILPHLLGRADIDGMIQTSSAQDKVIVSDAWEKAVLKRHISPEESDMLISLMAVSEEAEAELRALLRADAALKNSATKHEKNEESPAGVAETGGKNEKNEISLPEEVQPSNWLPLYTGTTFRELARRTGKSLSAVYETVVTQKDPVGRPLIRNLGKQTYVLTAWLNANLKK